jgi:outer membrane lipoprotein LolB
MTGWAARGALTLLLPVLVTACSTVPSADSDKDERVALYGERLARLSGAGSWALEGKLAVNSGSDGGSGHFRWQKNPDSHHMDFHGALGRGAWRLDSDPQGAELELADGRVYRSDSVRELVRQRVGWSVPVDYLSWWVRGLAAPGVTEHRTLDDRGRLTDLQQAGWFIEFSRYRPFGGEDMPVKVTARRDDSTVKLAIRRWTIGDGAPGNG